MCAQYESRKKIRRPGKLVGVWQAENETAQLVWAGFAKKENLAWWKRCGGVLVDIPADRFAERSDRDRRLIWDDMPGGHVIRGIIDPHACQPILKLVTRASTVDELAHFEHPRMPLIEPPLFSLDPVDVEEPESAQGELF